MNSGTHIMEHGVSCTHVIAFNVIIFLPIASFAPKFKQMDHYDNLDVDEALIIDYHTTINTQLVPSSYRYVSIKKYIPHTPIYLFFSFRTLL